jgi:2-isopropylmalate synthase
LRKSDIRQLIDIKNDTGAHVGLNLFIALSDLRHHVEGWHLEQVLSELQECLAFGRQYFGLVRVALEDATRTRPEVLAVAAHISATSGVTRFTIADTAGVATPVSTRRLFDFLLRECTYLKENAVAIEWHGHNDRGLGIANSIESIQSGAAFVHGTMLGVGERNGNAALDVLLLNYSLELKDRFNWTSLRAYHDACKKLFVEVLQESYPYFGQNTFATATGTHCAAIKKALEMRRADLASQLYSPPSVLSRTLEPMLLISPLSGRHSVEALLHELGVSDDPELVLRVLDFAKSANRTLSKAEVLEFMSTRPGHQDCIRPAD